jgi:hypothetical protein
MYRLIEYVNNYLGPERDAWEKARKKQYPPLVAKTNAAMYEGFLWLHLGVEIGAFPEAEAYTVTGAFFDDYFRLLKVREQRFEGRQVLSASSVQLQEIRSRFPSMEPLLNVAIEKKAPFSFQRCGFSNGAGLRAPFDVILMLLTAFLHNDCCQTSTTALNFLPDTEYYGLIRKAFGSFVLKDSFSSNHPKRRPRLVLDSDPDHFYQGFVGTVKHMATCQHLFRELLHSRALEDDALLLLHRFRAVHGWRVDLRRESVANRFKELHQFFGQTEAKIGIVDQLDGARVQKADFKSVWDFWTPRAFEANA